ncbi:MAG TPA: nucleoside-diphosphate sugar epimerase/dehydratase [Ilumatobacter sp.]
MTSTTGPVRPRRRPIVESLRRRLPLVHFALDGSMWLAAIPVGVWLRYDFGVDHITPGLLRAIAVTVGLQGVLGVAFGQYRRRWRYGSFAEVQMIALTALAVGVVSSVVLWWDRAIPRSVPLTSTVVCLFGQLAIRSAWRSYTEAQRRPTGPLVKPMVVVGAGDSGARAVQMLLGSPDSPYAPVALVDDDPAKANLRIQGVRVAGAVDDLAAVAERSRAQGVLIAVPRAGAALLRRIDEITGPTGLEVFVLPTVGGMLDALGLDDIKPLTDVDLLGRPPAQIDPAAIAAYLEGRRVMVTGAGGSIGGELCRQIAPFAPAALVMLDRDESGLHGTQLSLDGRGMLDDPNLILCDIRDPARLAEVFEQHRPEIVFHAAALKHLPLLEMHAGEAWKTNVLGTQHVLDAAARCGVLRFVNVSTDKAVNPISMLGHTKRITERLTAAAAAAGLPAVSVRFGNVLGSQGSVLTAFEAQAARGGPLTVTDPDVTRYFMTVDEACRLIVQAGAIGAPGETLVLEMGEPVRILDVARRIANRRRPPLEIVFTGLRPNEKLHEDLVAPDEAASGGPHPLISHLTVPPLTLDPAHLQGSVPSRSEIAAIAGRDPGTGRGRPRSAPTASGPTGCRPDQ